MSTIHAPAALLRSLAVALALASLPAAAKQKPKPAPKAKPQPSKQSAATPSGPRLRLSAWAAMPIDPTYLARTKGDYLKDPKQRASIGASIKDAKGILDDISFITNITIKGNGPEVEWDPLFLLGAPKERARYLRDVIAVAHDYGIKVLAGYAIGDTRNERGPRGQSFVKFIAGASDAQLQAHANNIVKFLWVDNKLDFDGFSWDLEINGLKGEHAPKMAKLYHYLAEILRKRGGGKVVAYATGLGVQQGNAIRTETLGSFMAQPFSIAKGYANIIARPMAYDVALSEPGLFQWHENIVKYGLAQGLKGSQLQLGIKVLGNSPGNVTDPSLVAKRAKQILRPRGAGLVIFTMGLSTLWARYKEYNEGLNGK